MNPIDKILSKVSVDRSEAIVMFSRLASFGAGPLTAVAVAVLFTQTVQGYYFTFVSLLGAQIFFEAGISFVLIQMTAHEVVSLQVDKNGVSGPAESVERLGSIFQFALRWFSVLSFFMFIGVGLVGWLSLSTVHSNVHWQLPWVIVLFACFLDFCMIPLLSILEGCSKIVYIYKYRTVRALLVSIVLFGAAWNGFGLYAYSLAVSCGVLYGIFVVSRFLPLFVQLHRTHGATINWKTEVWPFQWRMALSWISGYVTTSLFTPIVFAYQGAVNAGRIGFTIAVLNAISGIAFSLIQARLPQFGGMVAAKRWAELDKLYWNRSLYSFVLCMVGTFCLIGGVIVLNFFELMLAHRVLPIFELVILAVTFLLAHISAIEGSYLRCQRIEPFFFLSIICGGAILANSLIAGKAFGIIGIVVGYCLVYAFIGLPVGTWILIKNRQRRIGGSLVKPQSNI